MGTSAFDEFLSNTVSRYSWRVITGEELKAVAESTCACNLDTLWTEWVGAASSTLH